MPLTDTILLGEMTREQVREIAPSTTVILPTGAVEQHGPHLPIQTDAMVCEALCRRAAETVAKEVSVTVAPTLHLGYSHSHFPYPGVLSLSSRTYHLVLCDLLESLVRSGFKRIMIVSGHGENDALIWVASEDTVVKHDVRIATIPYRTGVRPTWGEEGRALEAGQMMGHAGGFETSCMMAVRPDLVGPDTKPRQRDPGPPYTAIEMDGPIVHVHAPYERIEGYSDDAREASADHGERFLAIMARELAKAIIQFARS